MIEDIIENATKRSVRCRQAQFSHPLSLFSLVIDRITSSSNCCAQPKREPKMPSIRPSPKCCRCSLPKMQELGSDYHSPLYSNRRYALDT